MLSNLKTDLPASIVVFFVALPLCLGIALASGAPLFSGLIAGIIGGIIVGFISGSSIGVSGPAAGLAAIVLTSIGSLGGYENFLLAVVLAGLIQICSGFLKAGIVAYYVPSSVIRGMLAGIGIIIVIKQIPHFFGYISPVNTDFTLANIFKFITPGSLIIGIVSLILILFWDNILSKKAKIFTIVQGPIVAVILGILFYLVTISSDTLRISSKLLVSIPVPKNLSSFLGQFTAPNFSLIFSSDIWIVAFTIALVASLETLLCVEATDKLDPNKNITPTNRELVAQGVGNVFSGLIGGLPITQVIVRSSANIQSGGKTKLSSILHGFFLLISIMTIPGLLNLIPLSVLASVLFIVGYKLAKPQLFIKMYNLGWNQFLPYISTVLGIVFIDLLYGVGIGMIIGLAATLVNTYRNSHDLKITNQNQANEKTVLTLAEEVTFLNKGAIFKDLQNIKENTVLTIDITKTKYLDYDLVDVFENFKSNSKDKGITIEIKTKEKTFTDPKNFSNIIYKQ